MANSIRRQLILLFISLAIAPLLLLGGIFAWQSYSAIESEVLTWQSEMANGTVMALDNILKTTAGNLRMAAEMHFLKRQDQDPSVALLKLLMAKDMFEKILLLDSEGKTTICLSRLGLSNDDQGIHSKDEAFVSLKTGVNIYYSAVRFDEKAGEPLITIAVPLVDIRSGLRDGVIVADVRLKVMWDLIAAVEVHAGQSIYIVDADGRLVAHANPSLVLRGTIFRAPDHDGVRLGLTGEETLMARKTVRYGNQELNVIVEQKTSEAFEQSRDLLQVTAALLILALSAAGGLGVLIVRRIVRPVQDMAKIAEAVSAGDLSQQVSIFRNDEVGVLAKAFNSMTVQLKNLIDGLEQKVAERTVQLENAHTELLRQERLAALGTVTASIAHEIRNPLGTVNTSIFSISTALERNQPEKVKRALGMAERNIRRCDNIITELLDYTRKLEIRPERVNIDSWINEILDEQTFPEELECRRNLVADLETAVDRELIRRAVVNVLTNAIHAAMEKTAAGRTVTVETAGCGQNLEIRIIDNGPGIREEVRDRIFEPLFSTKGFGVGLGLCITKDIMKLHHGGIDIHSEVDKGTTAVLWLPLSGEEAVGKQPGV